jgi:hypothetical protein
MLKNLGLFKNEDMRMPGDESTPHPPQGFRVIFTDFLVRGLSVPIHEFLRGLLFIYEIQLHQLTPNSILHISIFITLCECFLGIHPHWGLWKRISTSAATTGRTPSTMSVVLASVFGQKPDIFT